MNGDAEPLPEIREALLDEEKLAALLRDIASLTTVDEVIAKGVPGREPAKISIDDVQQLLLSGAIRGVQIRYRHEGAIWWDTLMRTAEGVKIVRIRHQMD